jgi:hypothetical protein
LWTDIEEIFSRQRQIGREELFAAWNVAHRIIAAGGRRTTYGILHLLVSPLLILFSDFIH